MIKHKPFGLSPLRYPGGKAKLAKFIGLVCEQNSIKGHYIEPYAGGASVALFLLLNGFVSEVTVNDVDRSIYAYWYSVLNHTEELCHLIETTDVSIERWRLSKEVQKNKNQAGLLELGFSTFFLNRTNMSGIIKAGVIGGVNQNGGYKMDCRFNKSNLINRIRIIASQQNKIHLHNLDAITLIETVQKRHKDDQKIYYFDPPYYYKGKSLYMNYYSHADHEEVSKRIQSIKDASWIVSYDDSDEIKEMYVKQDRINYSFYHTAHRAKQGYEVLFFSQGLKIPNISNPSWI